MSTGESAGPIYPERTEESGYRYLFSRKHHQGWAGAAQWLPSLSQDEEFAIFELADKHGISDEEGSLYGLRLGPDKAVLELGSWGEQVAEFPKARPLLKHGTDIHCGPLKKQGPPNRQGEELRPTKEVFRKMEKGGLLTTHERKRLFKGDHV